MTPRELSEKTGKKYGGVFHAWFKCRHSPLTGTARIEGFLFEDDYSSDEKKDARIYYSDRIVSIQGRTLETRDTVYRLGIHLCEYVKIATNARLDSIRLRELQCEMGSKVNPPGSSECASFMQHRGIKINPIHYKNLTGKQVDTNNDDEYNPEDYYGSPTGDADGSLNSWTIALDREETYR